METYTIEYDLTWGEYWRKLDFEIKLYDHGDPIDSNSRRKKHPDRSYR